MKLNFLFSSAFWGILLILFGVSAILKSFNIYIPFFRVAFALIFIYIGLSILLGGPFVSSSHNSNTIVFSSTNITGTTASLNNEYNVIFGKGVIDLTDIELENGDKYIELNTIFGEGILRINPELPIKIKADSAFGEARMPDGNTTSFGNYTFQSKNYEEGKNHLIIDASVVFGALKIEYGN